MSQGAILFEQINRIRNLLYFNVDTLCQTDESISMKGLMLRVMGVIDPREVDRQHDAAECLRSLLSVTNEMSFLWHHIEETLLCENCGLTTKARPKSGCPKTIRRSEMTNFFNRSRTRSLPKTEDRRYL